MSLRTLGVSPGIADDSHAVGPRAGLEPAVPVDFPVTHRVTRALLIGGLLLAAAVTLKQAMLQAPPVLVDVVRVTRGSVEETVSNTRAGTVKARRRARLSPEAGGRVVAIPHREGARVSRGALLVKLDDAMQRAQLELARQDVQAAQARSEEVCLAAQLAELERDRVLTLQHGGIASEQLVDSLTSDRDRSRAACRAARATLEQAHARGRVAQVDLARTELRAPFDGVVAEVGVEVGEWLSPSLPGALVAPAIDLLDPTSLYVTAPIDEMDGERVAVGQPVRLSVDSRRGEHFEGRLIRVAPYVADVVEQNRTVEVEAELLDRELAESLLPGTSADVEVILSRREGVLSIPSSALGSEGRVLVVAGDRIAERRVVTGLRNWRLTEVVEGLAEGEPVVTSRDSAQVKPAARVTVRGEG
jgi:HlyD family secretion protein